MLPAFSDQIIPNLQGAVGPVILISGVGLLLLTMTNRLGRAIDRSRILKHELAGLSGTERDRLQPQIEILYRLAKIIRIRILFAVFSALLAALLMITIFLATGLEWKLAGIAAVILIACLVSLCVSLVAFIVDINLSLHALKLELAGTVQKI